MKKTTKLLIGGLLTLPLLGACAGGGGTDSYHLTVWEDASNIEMLQEIADDFIAYYNRTYPLAPEVTIEFQPVGEAAAVSDLTTIGESGTGPDIAAITSDTLSTAVNNGLVAPVTYADGIRETFDEVAVTNATLDGDLYAYPSVAESTVIMYDKRQVSDPSIFDSFENLLASGKQLVWDVNDEDCAYYMFGFLTDSNLFGPNGTDESQLNLDTTQSVNNLVTFYNTYKSTIYTGTPETGPALVNATSNNVVGVVSSPFLLATMQNTLGAANVGLHTLPSIGGTTLRPFSGYKEYVVSSYSKNPALANEFANYLVSAESQAWRLFNKNYLPTRTSADIEEMISESDIMPVYQESYEESFAMPTITAMQSYWSPMITFFQRAWESTSVTADYIRTGLNQVEDSIRS